MGSFKIPEDLTVITLEKKKSHAFNGKQIVLIILTENWGFDALTEYTCLRVCVFSFLIQ